MITRQVPSKKKSVLLVDTLSATNDFGVELPLALDPLVSLTLFTIKGTRVRQGDCARIIVAFPEYWGSRSKFAKLVDQCRATWTLARELYRHRKGVVHVQFFRSAVFELPLYIIMRPFLTRIVYTAHNALPHECSALQRIGLTLWYRIVDRVHVLSRHTGEQLHRYFGVSQTRIVYAPHGNYDRFLRDHPPASKSETRIRLGVRSDEQIVLFFGLIRPYKGVARLIDAAPHIESDRCRILIVGACAEPLVSELRSSIESSVARRQISFLPSFVETQDLSDYIAAADVVVFPYLNIYQSGAVLMAMSYGRPVITSDLDGFREYIKDGENGWLVDTANSIVFGKLINQVISEPSRAEAVGAAARRSCDGEFNWRQIAETIVLKAYADD